jgi:tripartite-type tricarboxylate transporter receptor subunit TctC
MIISMRHASGLRASVSAIAALVLALCAHSTHAQQYPNKPIRIIVGTSPSGGTDFSARIFGQQLSSAFGQPVVIDNRPGASGLIGMELVARANPDGYTLLVLSVGHLMSASLTPKPAFDAAKDFTPISQLVSTPMLLAVHPSVPARTLTDLIKLAKSTNGKLTYASGGTGGVQHMATALFMHEAKIEMVHVPYKGSGPGIIDLLAGNVQMTMTGIAPLLPFINAGKLRALAVTGSKRSPVIPDVPTFSEFGLPGVAIDGWHGMLAPAKTPEPVVRKLALAVAQIARMPDIRAKLSAEGAVPIGSTPSEFAKFFLGEQQKWTRVARETLVLKK